MDTIPCHISWTYAEHWTFPRLGDRTGNHFILRIHLCYTFTRCGCLYLVKIWRETYFLALLVLCLVAVSRSVKWRQVQFLLLHEWQAFTLTQSELNNTDNRRSKDAAVYSPEYIVTSLVFLAGFTTVNAYLNPFPLYKFISFSSFWKWVRDYTFNWFVVGRPWTLVIVFVGQCVVRWLLCHSSFVVLIADWIKLPCWGWR